MCACEAVVYGAASFCNTEAGPDLKYLSDKKFLRQEIENFVSYMKEVYCDS